MVSLQEPVFCLTVPKSGTHLLANVIRALIGAENVYPGVVTASILLQADFTVEPKVYVGHVRYHLEASRVMGSAPKILLCRDPRDVVVSFCDFFYNRAAPDPLNQFIQSNAVSASEALSIAILGGRLLNTEYLDCMTLFTEYHIRWLPLASLAVRYEDLLLTDGDRERCLAAVRSILDVIGIEMNHDEIAERVVEGSDPSKSATFYQGRTGRWREYFSPAHVLQFKSVAPNLVSLLGYEPDDQWSVDGGETAVAAPRAGAKPALVAALSPGASSDSQVSANAATPAPVYTTAQLASLKREILRELDVVKRVVGRLKNLDDQVHHRISFLQEKDYGFFCWTNDWIQQHMNKSFWDHGEFVRFVAENRIRPHPDLARVDPGLPGQPVLPETLRPVLAAGRRVHFLDIGCWYGVQSAILSSALTDFGDAFRITAFDPGWAGKLAPFNFEINGHKDRINFEPLAVASHNRTSIVYGEYGQTENCRTVNRMVSAETFSYPCPSTTVDSYLRAKGIADPVFMAIDIQGGEYDALLGARETLENQCLGMLLKFIPHALQPTIDPGSLLSVIPGEFELYDVNDRQHFSECRIERGRFPEFAAELWRSQPDYTYLLILFDRYHAEPDARADARPRSWADRLFRRR